MESLLIGIWLDAFIINILIILLLRIFSIFTKIESIYLGTVGTLVLGSIGYDAWLVVFIELICSQFIMHVFVKITNIELNNYMNSAFGSFVPTCIFVIFANFWPNFLDILMVGFASTIVSKFSNTVATLFSKNCVQNENLSVLINILARSHIQNRIVGKGLIAGLLAGFLISSLNFVLNIIGTQNQLLLVFFSGCSTLFLKHLIIVACKPFNGAVIYCIQSSLAAVISMICYLYYFK